MTSPTAKPAETTIRQSSAPSLLECIQMRNWQKAIDVITADRKAVYEQRFHNNGRRIGIHHQHNNNNDVHTTGHLAIHELCRMTTSPTSVRFSQDEISDDEEDDGDDDESNDTAGELDQIFDACELEEGTKMYEVTQFMIDVSHSMGPVKVPTSPNDDDDDDHDENDTANNTNNDLGPVEVGRRDMNRNEPENDGDGEERNKNDRPSEVGSRRFAVHESILTYADSMGKTPLHSLCENSCDSNMMRLILGSTREATGNLKAPTAMSLILAKDSRGSTPLHYLAYSRQCPFSSLKLMMEYCKPRGSCSHNENGQRPRIDPTLCTDHDGETPLHWALAGYVSSRRIKELTRHSVDAIMVQNEKGEKPFDQFTTNFVDSDWTDHDVCGHEVWENIQEYLKCIKDNHVNNHQLKSTLRISNPQRTNEGECDGENSKQSQSNNSDWLPLHFLAGSSYDFPPIFTDLALKYCTADLRKADANDMLPLHLVCARKCAFASKKNAADALAMKILKKFQRASLVPSGYTKRLPLHFAVESQKPLSLIASLIRTYPRSLNIPDPVTRLWPYVLAGVRHDNYNSIEDDEHNNNNNNNNENESLSVSFALLRADPSVLHLVRKNEFVVSNLTDKERSRYMTERRKADEDYMEHSSRRIRRLSIRDD